MPALAMQLALRPSCRLCLNTPGKSPVTIYMPFKKLELTCTLEDFVRFLLNYHDFVGSPSKLSTRALPLDLLRHEGQMPSPAKRKRNIGSSKTTRAGEYLEEICAVHGLAQHVKTATRGNNPLDLILSDLEDCVSVDVTSPIGRSDHSVLLTKIATCPQREKRTSRRVWRYSKADWVA